MNRTFKVILIISLILNMLFLVSIGVIVVGVGAIGFKAISHYYHLTEDGDHIKYHRRNENYKKIFSSLKDNEQIREEIDQMKSLRKEVRKTLASDDPLGIDKIEAFLNRIQTNVINITKTTHMELIENLKNMSEEERRESIEFFFRKRRGFDFFE